MKREISAKQKLILIIIVSILWWIVFIVVGVGSFYEDEKERKQVRDTYVQTQAIVIEAGEVKETRARYATGWNQQCVIEYKRQDGKITQVKYRADNHKEQRPLEVGSKIEILVSPDNYREVRSAHEDTYPYIPVMVLFAVLGLVISGGLIAIYASEYRRKPM
nr:hypothetical protein [Eubacterium sp.]